MVIRSQRGIFGVDLGTTYSSMAYLNEVGNAVVTRNSLGDDTTPSVVYFESKNSVVVGQVAKESAGLFPGQVVSLIKREMGDRDYRRIFFDVEYTPPSISAIILAALAQDAEDDTGRRVTDVVITVPAYFGTLERDATRQAGEIAGLNVIGIVPEPVAAALHYGITGSAKGKVLLVYDLGGGTFDISLIRMTGELVEVLAVGGDHRLGGADWDQKVLDYIVDQVITQCGDESLYDDEAMLQDLRTLAEKTKKDLSAAETRTIIVRYAGQAARVTLTRSDFQRLTADLLEETVRITQRTLAQAEQIRPGICGQISEVLLTGGATYMPAVREALNREFGWNPKLVDPDLAVAKGAALYAAQQTVRLVEPTDSVPYRHQDDAGQVAMTSTAARSGIEDDAVRAVADQTGLTEEHVRALAARTVVNVLPKAIGIKLLDTARAGWEGNPASANFIEHLVSAQTQLPYSINPIEFRTVVPNQQEIEIEIWEQAGAIPDRDIAANHPLDASGRISGLGRFALPAGSPISFEMNIDHEGTVRIRVVEPASSQELEFSVRISVLSSDQVAEAKAAHAGLIVST
jgi:molecular chaperone DnaK